MKILNKILIFCLIALLVDSLSLSAQPEFSSGKIMEVYTLLPQQVKNQIETESFSKKASFCIKTNINNNDLEINARYSDHRELEHLGLLVFAATERVAGLEELFDYIERSMLISKITNELYPFEKAEKKDNIEIMLNGQTLSKQKKAEVFTSVLTKSYSVLNTKHTSDFFWVQWLLNNGNILSIKIPNNYFTIAGQTKDELEKELLRKLKASKSITLDKTTPDKSQLKSLGNNILYLPGQIYSTTPELSSAKYFRATDSIMPVFDKSHHKESIRNLFLNTLRSDLKINVNQKMYGGQDEAFSININNLYSVFANDFNIYFGWQNDEKENLKASIFFSHKIYPYNHLLVITGKVQNIFRKNGEVQGLLMTYIPREITTDFNQK